MTRLRGFTQNQEGAQEQHDTRAQLLLLFTGQRRDACPPRAPLVPLRKPQDGFWGENLDASPSAAGTCGCVGSWPQPPRRAERVSGRRLEGDVLEHTPSFCCCRAGGPATGMWAAQRMVGKGGRTAPSKALPTVCQLPAQNMPWSAAVSAIRQMLKKKQNHFIASFFHGTKGRSNRCAHSL